jgi:tripartite-type tricarboxylate transporter receptor subunit TctC
LRTALESKEVRNRLAIEGAEPLPSTPEQYAIDIDREETQWSKVIKASGAKAE